MAAIAHILRRAAQALRLAADLLEPSQTAEPAPARANRMLAR